MSILDAEKATVKTAEEQLAELKAENERLKAKLATKPAKGEGISVTVEHDGEATEYILTLKASEKGAVSIYGVGRFPVTLYPKHLLAVCQIAPAIVEFVKANASKLSWAKASK